MNWEAVGAIAELCGAIAVVVTLVYLALQVNQNTVAMKGTTIDAVTDRIFQEQRWAADLAEVFFKIESDPKSVTPPERIKYLSWISAGLRNRQNEFFQHQQGSLDDQIWDATIRTIPLFLSEPSARAWWDSGRSSLFADDFRIFVNGILEENSDS